MVIAQDVSESVRSVWQDGGKGAYLEQLGALERTLSDDYTVETLSFGNRVRPGIDTSFSDKVTNTSEVLSQIYDTYAGGNLGGVILSSDGLFNEGTNPLYTADDLGVPVFTIALGDTTPQKDLVIKRVFNNRIAYLDDKFTVEIDVAARNIEGRTSSLVGSR
ncbi:MAG: hypothetical protein HRU40_17310, partial [Saprospiraceae bacterium]|nr:hypothetical protein [Saprospiraceae bacterium]